MKVRVKVFNGDRDKLLGFGTYVGNVDVYAVLDEKGNLLSFANAEEKPSQEVIDEIKGTLEHIKDNPKIVMDDGTIMYGCQVWWEEVSVEEYPLP